MVARTRNVTPNSNGRAARVWAGSWRGDTEDGSSFDVFYFLFFYFDDSMLIAGSESLKYRDAIREAFEVRTHILRWREIWIVRNLSLSDHPLLSGAF